MNTGSPNTSERWRPLPAAPRPPHLLPKKAHAYVVPQLRRVGRLHGRHAVLDQRHVHVGVVLWGIWGAVQGGTICLQTKLYRHLYVAFRFSRVWSPMVHCHVQRSASFTSMSRVMTACLHYSPIRATSRRAGPLGQQCSALPASGSARSAVLESPFHAIDHTCGIYECAGMLRRATNGANPAFPRLVAAAASGSPCLAQTTHEHTWIMDPAARMVRGLRGSCVSEVPRYSNARLLSLVLRRAR